MPTLVVTYCGDGNTDFGEECDDGNANSADSCSNDCKAVPALVASAPICGNGALDTAEECDDGNRRDGDGCTGTCLLEIGICGDGIVQSLLGEQCEQSKHDTTLPFDCVTCLFLSRSCGDRIIDPGEECDDGPRNSTSTDANCRPDCHSYRCGDGILDSAEVCDDGNRTGSDGCDRFCKPEEDSVVASAAEKDELPFPQIPSQVASQIQMQFPQFLPFGQMQYPMAQFQPLVAGRAPVGDTGPAAVAVIGAGAAAGFSFIRNRRKYK